MLQSKSLRTPETGIVFWLWLLSATAAAVVTATGFYLFGQVSGIAVVATSFVLLEIPQGIIMHRYAHKVHWAHWIMWGSLGLLAAIPLAVVIDFIAEAGGGLNPETDVRGCLFQGLALSAFIFGFVQNAPSKNPLAWGFIYAAAATVAGFVGGLVGFSVYHDAKPPFGYGVSDSPARAIGMAAGFLFGMPVYGIVTGLAVAYSLRFRAADNEGSRQVTQ